MNRIVKLLDRHVMVRKSVADVLLGVAVILINLFMITVGVQKYITTGYGNSYGITPVRSRVLCLESLFSWAPSLFCAV